MDMRMGRRPFYLSRVIAGCVVALLMVMQGVAVFASASAHIAHSGSEAGIIALPGCSTDKVGGSAPLEPGRNDCLQRCALLGAPDCGASPPWGVAHSLVSQFRTFPTGAKIARGFVDDDGARPIGWASSWSSRAPPSFS
jgi:hypothetical protein